MLTFLGGAFMGVIIGLAIGSIFMRDKFIEIKPLDDKKTTELMNLLDLTEGENNAA